jgi:hypothetical protein
MANFCPKCGRPAAGAKFCLQCGTALDAQQPVAAPVFAAPQPKGSSALKIVLIAIVVLAGLGVAGVIGAAIFIKHKVHDKMAEIKARTGVDIPGVVDGARTSHASREKRDGCLMLSKDEAQGILGFALTRADGLENGGANEHCGYYADPAAIQVAREKLRSTFESLRTGHAKTGEGVSQAEELTKSFVTSANNGSVPILEITIYRGDGKLSTSAFDTAGALMGYKAEHVAGPWDEATFGPLNSTLTIRKGDNGAMIDLRQVPDGRAKGLALAKVIARRL